MNNAKKVTLKNGMFRFKPYVINHKGEAVTCAFCKTPITRRRFSAVGALSINITCAKHGHLSNVYNLPFWFRYHRSKSLRKKFGITNK